MGTPTKGADHLPPKQSTETRQTEHVNVTSVTPAWLPLDFFTALQSASYILVLMGGWLFLSSRAYLRSLVEKHFDMIESLKAESRKNLELTAAQHDTIEQLTLNNNVLSSVIVQHLQGVNFAKNIKPKLDHDPSPRDPETEH